MNKFTKIVVSFLLILSIILNPLASVFAIRVSASGTAVAFGKFIVDFIIEQIVFQVGNHMWQYSIDNPDKVANAFKFTAFSNFENFVTAPDVIQVEYDIYEHPTDGITGTYKPTGFYLDPTVSLSDEQMEAYQLIVDTCNEYIAEGGDSDLVMYQIGNAYGFDPIGYEELKTKLANKFIQKSFDDGVNEIIQAGVLPTYDFNFVGPMPSISHPFTTGMASLQKDGFFYSVPLSSSSLNGMGYFIDPDVCKSYSSNFDNVSAVKGNSAMGFYFTHAAYGYSLGKYVMYNNKLYYSVDTNFHDIPYNNSGNSRFIYPDYFPFYVDVEGNTFASVYDGGIYSVGIYWNKTGEVAASMPVVESVTNESDFEQTTGGGEVEIPRSEAEQIIGNALGLGLISPDSFLEIGADGTITSADGISLGKLQEICDLIAEGNLQFDDIQSYLDLMTQLIGAGNLTATEQALLLENIKELEEIQADELTAIKDIISSIAIESEIAVDTDFNIDTPDTIINKFPFCLPFDVYTVFNLLSAEPEAPVFDIPFKMDGVFDYSMSIDLSDFDAIANIVRWFIYIIFILGLIFVTNGLIGRG